MGILDFFSHEAGQKRRAWLDEKDAILSGLVDHYIGPTGIMDKVRGAGGLLDFTDAGDMPAAADASRTMWNNPSVGNAAELAAAGAALALPMYGARMGQGFADTVDEMVRAYDPTMVRSVGPKAKAKGIKAYHGSPHDFDKFSMDKIGTGEGAQAYGHGLYFAENEAVARGYKDALKMKGYDNSPIYNEAVSQHGFGAREFDQFESLARQTIHDPDLLARAFFDWNDEWKPLAADPTEYKNVRDFAEKYIKSTPKGSMYEVNINANPDDFLDWDAPLSAQSPKVREMAQTAGIVNQSPDWRFNGFDGGYFRKTENGSVKVGEVRHLGGDQYRAKVGKEELGIFSKPEGARAAIDRALEQKGGAETVLQMKGRDVYDRLSGGVDSLVHSTPRRPEATKAMQDAGIPGIKYRDAGSRGLDGAEGTRNYVVFDENLISIVKKYGIAGAAAMLGVSALDVGAAMAEGQQQQGPR